MCRRSCDTVIGRYQITQNKVFGEGVAYMDTHGWRSSSVDVQNGVTGHLVYLKDKNMKPYYEHNGIIILNGESNYGDNNDR